MGGESPIGLYTACENVKNLINDYKESKRAVFVHIPCAIWGCECFYSSSSSSSADLTSCITSFT